MNTCYARIVFTKTLEIVERFCSRCILPCELNVKIHIFSRILSPFSVGMGKYNLLSISPKYCHERCFEITHV